MSNPAVLQDVVQGIGMTTGNPAILREEECVFERTANSLTFARRKSQNMNNDKTYIAIYKMLVWYYIKSCILRTSAVEVIHKRNSLVMLTKGNLVCVFRAMVSFLKWSK